MKYISNILLLLLVLAVGSCSEDFLDTFPTDQLGSDQVLGTIENQRAALEGIHRHMYGVGGSQDERAGYGNMMINYDFLGHDVVNPQRGSGWFINVHKWIEHRDNSSSLVTHTYDYFYSMIANANNIINSIDAIEGDENEKKNIKGQAYFYRAFAHFNMVQLYAPRYRPGEANNQLGIVINLDDLNNLGEPKARSTVDEVYDQIESDLNAALQNLTSSTVSHTDKSQIRVNVVNGVLARVALTKGEWANAITYARAARQGFTLTPNSELTQGFNNDGASGWIWASHVIPDHGTFFASFFAYMSYNYSSTHIRNNPKCINADLYDLIPSTDVRKGFWAVTPAERAAINIPSNFAKYAYMNTKFEALPSGTIGDGDVVLMRVAEMILIEAEANAHLGNDVAARTVLFELVSERDPNAVLSTNSGQALLNEILVQRRIELWGEGFNFLDLKRLNLPLNRPQRGSFNLTHAAITNVAPGGPEWQYLFPISAININPLLQQNP
ncbi:RagB/SusD family nutrient uptake outer membrane protein [Roseivirga thermotolerans]|uniref:Membrane protein n=1 Tax=Roseivirga thermotolerans TaxID=1758176 RepID=A0ABQ3I2X0_9BACT|nr:RagB/SusD family nutrient uptake outer membrane protein [Roseivirga thermotolerans]GHE56484.1 membrane protein [Roseivirga thermotolerans]